MFSAECLGPDNPRWQTDPRRVKPTPIGPVPELTVYVAPAAFPDGNPYLSLRDALGTFSDDERFVALLPNWGRHAEARWRLALVTVFRFVEGLPDRQGADAVRGRINVA